MKRVLCALLLLCLLMNITAVAEEETEISVNLTVGETYQIEKSRVGVWENAEQNIAMVNDDVIEALAPGRATILMISDGGLITRFVVTVSEIPAQPKAKEPTAAPATPQPTEEPMPDEPTLASDTPALVQAAIDLALTEWSENKGKTFSRLGSKNKFSRWQCGTGSGCNIGWCGAFVGYCMDTAGVPMDEYKKSVPHEDGAPYAVRAAGVGKIYTGYQNMNRLTDVPKPGYLVIYGKQGGYAYLHVGMVTAVTDNGDGTFIVQTVEGNVSNRIKRYCYLYDQNGGKKNFKACPEELRTDTETFQYTPHDKNWMITTFCQTWQ